MHAFRALVQRLAYFLRVSISAGQPERNAQRPQLSEVDHVAFAVDRLAGSVQLELAAWGRIMATRRRAFDDEAVNAAVGPPEHGRDQRVGGDDSQEPGPVENRKRAFREVSGIEQHLRILPLDGAYYRQLVFGRMLRHKGV